MKKGTVVVGMSGGVDSSVAAYILKEQGYNVIGVTMKIWQEQTVEEIENNGGCCGISAVDDARRIAAFLDIPYYVLNFRDEFKKSVIDYFVYEYENGRTPNPCIACNRYVKWEALLNRAEQIGADYIATGHYSRIDIHPETGRLAVKASKGEAKDQTYALYNLTQEQLKKTLMPIGDYTKDEIRKIAEKIDLTVAKKPDSQEICFIPDNNHAKFIENQKGVKALEGNYVDVNGNIIGKHKGIINYTIGQRKGLGVSFGKHMYVVEIRPQTNEVVLADNDALFKREVYAKDINFMAFDKIPENKKFYAKIRYNQKKAPCIVKTLQNGAIKCIFDEPQRAITPGQALVVYDGDYVAFGGVITTDI